MKLSGDRYEFANSLSITSENIFVSSRGKCDSLACGIVSSLDLNSQKLWSNGYSDIYGGNTNTLLIIKDTIWLSSYEAWSKPNFNFHLLKNRKEDGQIIDKYKFNYDTLSIHGVNCQGILKFNNNYLIFGEYRDKNNIAGGLIQWINFDGTPLRTNTYQLNNNKSINPLEDLQPDGYGNLVFITTYRDSLLHDYTVIRKINDTGISQKNLLFPADVSLEPRPQLSVLTNKNYVFTHKTREIPENGFINVVQLICADSVGNILWKYNYPWKIFGQDQPNISNNYTIDVITSTSDGGAIIAGKIRTNRIQNRFYDDAYIGKFSVDGELQWERRINILDGRDTLYDWCSLEDIKERPDGKGYIAVGLHTPSDTSHTNIMLVSIDNDGCIEGLECSNNHYVVSTIDNNSFIKPNKVTIYPNPFQEILNIFTDDSENLTINIRDTNGKIIINQKNVNGTLNINTSAWPIGVFIVTIQNQNGIIASSKIIRI